MIDDRWIDIIIIIKENMMSESWLQFCVKDYIFLTLHDEILFILYFMKVNTQMNGSFTIR